MDIYKLGARRLESPQTPWGEGIFIILFERASERTSPVNILGVTSHFCAWRFRLTLDTNMDGKQCARLRVLDSFQLVRTVAYKYF